MIGRRFWLSQRNRKPIRSLSRFGSRRSHNCRCKIEISSLRRTSHVLTKSWPFQSSLSLSLSLSLEVERLFQVQQDGSSGESQFENRDRGFVVALSWIGREALSSDEGSKCLNLKRVSIITLPKKLNKNCLGDQLVSCFTKIPSHWIIPLELPQYWSSRLWWEENAPIRSAAEYKSLPPFALALLGNEMSEHYQHKQNLAL